jgi:hypothetical protein
MARSLHKSARVKAGISLMWIAAKTTVPPLRTALRAVGNPGHFPGDEAAMKLPYLVLNHAAEH